MKGRHIVVFTNLGNGHVYPTLGVCRELVDRGYRVTYVTNDYYAAPIRQTGAKPVIFTPASFEMSGHLEQRRFMSVSDPQRWTLEASCIYPWFMKDAIETLHQVDEIFSKDTPDVILYDRLAFAGRILARRLDVPAVQLSCVVPPYKNYIVRTKGVCMTPEPIQEFSKRLDRFFAQHGIEEKDNLFHIEALNICFIPKEFHHHAEWFDNRFCFIGACLNRPFKPTWKRTDSSNPIVLVSGLSDGDDVEYFKLVMRALAGLDYHVILSIGRHIDDSTLGDIPSNFEINRGADHLEMLPYVALMVCQGGVGTIMESIYHGVPVICIPTDTEQDDNSYRAAELGLGRYLHRAELTVDVIRECVAEALADGELLERVSRMQEVFRRSGGAPLAADRIDQLLGEADA